MMVKINADKEEAEVVRVKVEAEEASANEKVGWFNLEAAEVLDGTEQCSCLSIRPVRNVFLSFYQSYVP